MHGLRGSLIRFFGAIIFGLVTFWPSYGLVFLAVTNFSAFTLPIVALTAIWVAAFFLFLPVPLWMFGRVSLASLLIVFVVGFVAAFNARIIDPTRMEFWLTWGVAGLFALIGWLMIATPLWRLFHGVVAVEDREQHNT